MKLSDDMLKTAEDILVRELAKRVVERILARRRRALVVYTGALIGADDALESLKALRRDGYEFTLLLSEAAGKLHDVEALKAALEPEECWVGEPARNGAALSKEFDTFICPELSVNSCAHLVSCMTDTPAQLVLVEALMRGKTVVCAIDGCCPDNVNRPKLGFAMPEPMKQLLRENLESLRSYGARLTTCENLAAKVRRAVEGEVVPKAAPAAPKAAASAPAADVIDFSDHLLTATFVRGLAAGTTVRVSKQTIVSPLAFDEARARGVSIQ